MAEWTKNRPFAGRPCNRLSSACLAFRLLRIACGRLLPLAALVGPDRGVSQRFKRLKSFIMEFALLFYLVYLSILELNIKKLLRKDDGKL